MLNNIALNCLLFSVHGPLKDPDGYNFPESALFSESVTLPILLEGTRIHLGIVFALLSVAVIWAFLSKSFVGFQIQVLGKDQSAARFAGFRDDLDDMLGCADILVHPASREGLGVAMLKGAAAGLPVVAFAVAGAKEAVVHDETGLLVTPGSVQGLLHAISELIENPKRRQ